MPAKPKPSAATPKKSLRSSRSTPAQSAKNQAVLPPAYQPSDYEQNIYAFWLKQGYFRGERDPDKQPYCISMPPPNITGVLHLGHVTGNAIQDALIRFERMRGKAVLYLPGTDHAAISTQVVVEERLAREGKTRHDLGREKFLQRVRDFVDTTKARIHEQERRLGISADWSRERYTLDEHMSHAVYTAFARMYKEGLIYRGKRIISWCPRCVSSLSDIEVLYKQTPGNLWFIKYPLVHKDKTTVEQHIVVATTRPETMLGDTAVAVNPKDRRYKKLIGKKVRLPLVGREIPIIADDHVDMNFGTGALKVTPAHDLADYEIAQRHRLQAISVIGEHGRMTQAAGKFAEQEVGAARDAVVSELKTQGFLHNVEEFSHSVPVCERCATRVEPLISKQWFVKVEPLAQKALAAVRSGQIKIVPANFTKTYYQWMENIHDWNISRQIWWGHRIPVFTCTECEHEFVSEQTVSTCPKCKGVVTQDPDTLDTWFSSGLWTFATLGWPDKTEDLEFWHPTDVLETGRDILFFWVSRMIMLSLYFMGEVPFTKVYLHGLVLDKHGKKMSKSRGNGIDPIDMADRYGMDAVRLSLVAGVSAGLDTRLAEEKIAYQRNFINKLWNVVRFVVTTTGCERTCLRLTDIKLDRLALEDQWILHRLDELTEQTTRALEEYRFSDAVVGLQNFVWNELADWYLETTKLVGASTAATTAAKATEQQAQAAGLARAAKNDVLLAVTEQVLTLLHPFTPFVTEVLWQELKKADPEIARRPDLIVAPWPSANRQLRNARAAADFGTLQEMIKGLRAIRADYRVAPGIALPITTASRPVLQQHQKLIEHLARVQLSFGPSGPGLKRTIGSTVVFADIAGSIDVARELARVKKEADKVSQVLTSLQKRLASKVFTAKAPAAVVAKEREREHELRAKLEQLQALVTELSKIR